MTTDIYIVRAVFDGGSKDVMATTSTKQADEEVLRLVSEKITSDESRFVSVQSAIDQFLAQNPEPDPHNIPVYNAWYSALQEFSAYQRLKADVENEKRWPPETAFYVMVVPFKVHT